MRADENLVAAQARRKSTESDAPRPLEVCVSTGFASKRGAQVSALAEAGLAVAGPVMPNPSTISPTGVATEAIGDLARITASG